MKEIHDNLTQQVDKSSTSLHLMNNIQSNFNLKINSNLPGISPINSESGQNDDGQEEEDQVQQLYSLEDIFMQD